MSRVTRKGARGSAGRYDSWTTCVLKLQDFGFKSLKDAEKYQKRQKTFAKKQKAACVYLKGYPS